MKTIEVNAKTILRKQKKIDSWFLSYYGMNLYRGCEHNCVYCDGRSEKYQVDDDFGEKVIVKKNAVDILRRELDTNRRRTPFKKGYIMLGGGVGDSYQPVEKKYMLTRKTLQLLKNKDFPVHILTKSTLVKRDLELIKDINKKKRVIVSFSFSSTNPKISRIFEPNVPIPKQRLKTLSLFKKHNIFTGMYLLPVIPFITDKPDIMEDSIRNAKENGVDFIVFGGMTLKKGRQKQYFMDKIRKYYPDLRVEYNNIYQGDKWGNATGEYYQSINKTFNVLTKKYGIPKRIPPKFFIDVLSENDRVIVILEHIDYILKTMGRKSPYGYAAYSISKINQPLSTMKYNLQSIKGVGKTTEKIIQEILKTGTSSYYEKLLI